MSIFKYLLDSDWRQRADLDDLNRRARNLSSRIRASNAELRQEVEQLQTELAGVCLFNRALLRVLVDKGLVSQEEFQQKMNEADREDGILDGK